MDRHNAKNSPDYNEKAGYDLNMRRSTVADVTRHGRRRSSATAQRQGRKQSVGSAVKEVDKSRPSIPHPRSNSNLLSMAVKEEVQKRVCFVSIISKN